LAGAPWTTHRPAAISANPKTRVYDLIGTPPSATAVRR
jgi:hypothetical protein